MVTPKKKPEPERTTILQGTLDLMVLKSLDVMGPQHGFGIAQRLDQISESMLQPNQGTVYAALLRLQQRGWIRADWGTSENGRRAKFYELTRSGRKQLAAETEGWKRVSAFMGRLLSLRPQD